MSKHTPGPWMVDVEAGDEWWFGGASGMQAVIRPQGGPSYESIAVYGFDVGADDEPTIRANMNLIAAAPDMLAALEACIAFTGAHGGPFEAARNAVKKAKGEA